jgi:predicted transglutaminase-like cysteine proteinase
VSTQNERRSRPTLLSLLGLALAGLWLTACSATTSGAPHLVAHQVTAPPVGAFAFCMENQDACGPVQDQAATAAKDLSKSSLSAGVEMSETADAVSARDYSDEQLLAMARVVNASINTMISYRSDALTWNMEERWVLPLSSEGVSYGDCEDFALEKRAALLEAGAPADRMRMATAWSPGTGEHAVLILRLAAGDYVLDNTTPHILTVGQTRYQWRSIQTGPSLLEWSTVSNEPQPSSAEVYTAG